MSKENVETLRRWYEAANRRDDAAIEYLAPELEFRTAGIFPDMDPVYRGRDEFVSFLYRFAEPWEEHAKGRDGIEVELPFAHLWTLRDGRAVQLVAYADQREALEAAGLSE